MNGHFLQKSMHLSRFPGIVGVLGLTLFCGTACLRTLPSSALDPGVLLLSTGNSVAAVQPPALGTTTALYPGFENWNDYIQNDGTNRFTATGTACNSLATGGYGACIHAGLMKSIAVSNRTSCDGISASDSAGALFWGCDDSTGSVRVLSLGVRPGQGLKDLIDFSNGTWRGLSVTVTDSGGTTTTDAGQLWNNPIRLNDTSTSPIDLADAGTVYAYSSNPGDFIDITAERVALVTNQDFPIFGGGGAGNLIDGGAAFMWIEPGLVLANGYDRGLVLGSGARFSVVNVAFIQSATQASLRLNNAENNLIQYVKASNNSAANVVRLFTASWNTFDSLWVSNGTANGLRLESNSDNNIFINLTTTSSAAANINLDTSAYNVFYNATSANSSNQGLRLNSNATDNTFVNFVSVNNNSGIQTTDPTAARNTWVNPVATHTANTGFNITSDNNYFLGNLKVGNNTTNCTTSGTLPGLDNACANNGSSTATRFTGVSLMNSHVGSINPTEDNSNTSDTGGTATGSAITVWVLFDSLFRAWSLQGAATYPSTTQQGQCIGAAACDIYDWRLRTSDSNLRGVLTVPDGNLSLPARWNVTGQAHCETIPGAFWASNAVCSYPGYFDSASCTGAGGDWATAKCFSVVLGNAYEFIGDNIGNENGLCESDEQCIYSPNIGSYQGEGTLNSAGSFTDGSVQGVNLLQWGTNGQ